VVAEGNYFFFGGGAGVIINFAPPSKSDDLFPFFFCLSSWLRNVQNCHFSKVTTFFFCLCSSEICKITVFIGFAVPEGMGAKRPLHNFLWGASAPLAPPVLPPLGIITQNDHSDTL